MGTAAGTGSEGVGTGCREAGGWERRRSYPGQDIRALNGAVLNSGSNKRASRCSVPMLPGMWERVLGAALLAGHPRPWAGHTRGLAGRRSQETLWVPARVHLSLPPSQPSLVNAQGGSLPPVGLPLHG